MQFKSPELNHFAAHARNSCRGPSSQTRAAQRRNWTLKRFWVYVTRNRPCGKAVPAHTRTPACPSRPPRVCCRPETAERHVLTGGPAHAGPCSSAKGMCDKSRKEADIGELARIDGGETLGPVDSSNALPNFSLATFATTPTNCSISCVTPSATDSLRHQSRRRRHTEFSIAGQHRVPNRSDHPEPIRVFRLRLMKSQIISVKA